MEPKLFGTSGARGVVNEALTPLFAAQMGLAVTSYSGAKDALVATDTRVSGPMLENALVSGLESGGAKVRCLGIAPTPALAFLTRQTGADVGIMITASHNPPQYNGIKIFTREGVAYGEKSQNEIEEIMRYKRFELADWRNIGHAERTEQNQAYVKMIEEGVQLRRKRHVVVDPGCGATYELAPTILRKVGCNVTAMNAQPDGWFPARSPEPTAQSVTSLAHVVKIAKSDAGLGYDGDGDRAVFVDEKGAFADLDRTLAAYAAHVTKKCGGGTVVTTVEASMCVEKMVEAQGGKVVRTKVGDIHVSEEMKRQKAVFGGEPCGAWIHPQFHCCPDGILSSVLLLQALEDEKKSLAELVAQTPRYSILRENFTCPNDQKNKILTEVEEKLKSAFPTYKEASTVDGFRLTLENGWILVRASGTEPTVRLTVEGESLRAAKQIIEKGSIAIKKSGGKM